MINAFHKSKQRACFWDIAKNKIEIINHCHHNCCLLFTKRNSVNLISSVSVICKYDEVLGNAWCSIDKRYNNKKKQHTDCKIKKLPWANQ